MKFGAVVLALSALIIAGSILPMDAGGLALGMLFGLLAGVPAAWLIIAGGRSGGYDDDGDDDNEGGIYE